MLEILFGESEAAGLKLARRNNKAIGEVCCLAFLLDSGDIQAAPDSERRRDWIISLYDTEAGGKEAGLRRSLGRAVAGYVRDLARVREALQDGETVRVWYSDAPYALCGLYHLCHLAAALGGELSVVRLPAYTLSADTLTAYASWGEAAPETFAAFLPKQRRLAGLEVQRCARIWAELVRDNSPLRASVNGQLTGVPADFYDFLLWKHLTGAPVKEAQLLGEILGRHPLGIGDWWYAGRIEHWIRQGKIQVVTDSRRRYERVLCRAEA